MNEMNNFILNNYYKIRLLLLVIVVMLAGCFTYLLFTQPHKTPKQDLPVSVVTAHPVVKNLPYVDAYYTVAYKTVGTGNDIVITVHTPSPRYRYEALKRLYALGINPTDYNVEYTDFVNPLGGN